MSSPVCVLSLIAGVALLGSTGPAWAKAPPTVPVRALVLPTIVAPRPPCAPAEPAPSPLEVRALDAARRIDGLMKEAVQDVGLDLEASSSLTAEGVDERSQPSEQDLLALAKGRWVFVPVLAVENGAFVLRLTAAPPDSRVLRVLAQPVSPDDLAVRTARAVTDLVERDTPWKAEPSVAAKTSGEIVGQPVQPPRSAGRGVLAITSAALGGSMGYSLQRASGSDDPRLTYPLMALGTGMGLGASMIATEEWDIGVGDAWYINAGALWPTAGGLLLAAGYDVEPSTDRYVYGLVGAASGMTLAIGVLATRDIGEGPALVAHSGGFFGTFLGALGEMTVRGSTDIVPRRGMGFGANAGVLLGGAAATLVDVAPSRVVFIDISAGLGALTGAAAGSPLLFVKAEPLPVERQRAWLVGVGLGTVVGAGVGWYLTRGWNESDASQSRTFTILPYVSPNATPLVAGAGAWTAGVVGQW